MSFDLREAQLIGRIVRMTELATLPDDEVLARARQWRTRSLRGDVHARGFAHEYEVEARRRFSFAMTIKTPLEAGRAEQKRAIWRFWKS